MQVQQRQHLGHLGALAAPGRQAHRAEADPLAGDQIGAAVIHPRRPHQDRTRGSHHLALAGMAVADHQPPATDEDGEGQRQPELHHQPVTFCAPAQLAVLVGPGMGALDHPSATGLDGCWHPTGGDLCGHPPLGQDLPAGFQS
jgi:hypothetical protein